MSEIGKLRMGIKLKIMKVYLIAEPSNIFYKFSTNLHNSTKDT